MTEQKPTKKTDAQPSEKMTAEEEALLRELEAAVAEVKKASNTTLENLGDPNQIEDE